MDHKKCTGGKNENALGGTFENWYFQRPPKNLMKFWDISHQKFCPPIDNQHKVDLILVAGIIIFSGAGLRSWVYKMPFVEPKITRFSCFHRRKIMKDFLCYRLQFHRNISVKTQNIRYVFVWKNWPRNKISLYLKW